MAKRKGRVWTGERYLYPFSGESGMPKWCSSGKVRITITQILPKSKKGKKPCRRSK